MPIDKLTTDAQAAADTFRQAARLNREDPDRKGSTLHLPDYGQVVMTGDLHGHERNFRKLQRFCDLKSAAARRVILHELIHAEPDVPMGLDTSLNVMLAAASWKVEFPDQVHFLHSNHEMAQLTGKEICKAGRIVTREFDRAVESAFGSDADGVMAAIFDYIDSFVLAARTANRIMLCHSLPGLRDLDRFDFGVFDRPLTRADFHEGGSAYSLVWGRYHSAELLNRMAEACDVDFFICGHQPQDQGYDIIHDRMIILASDHNHGVFLPFDLKKPYTIRELETRIRPFASIE